MSDQNIAAYSAAHRNRDHDVNGWVKLTGTREKKWNGWFYVYQPQADGTSKRVRRKVTLGTKVELPTKGKAEEALRLIVRRQLEQPMAVVARAKVSDLCDDYLNLHSGDWEPVTRTTNSSVIATFIKPAIGHLAIDKVTAEDLKRLVNDLPNRTYATKGRIERGADGKLKKVPGKVKKGVSRSYAIKVITHLRALFDLASERELVRKNPARSVHLRLKLPKQVKEVDKSVFPPQHLPALLAELDVRDRLIVWLSILGATRPGELFAVRGGDVGPGAAWIHIERALDRRKQVKTTKTGKARFVHLPPDLAVELQAWIGAQRIGAQDWIFQNRDGNPMDNTHFITYRLRPAAKRAMIPVQDVDFQMLRRSFATLAQYTGMDIKAIQSQLGHSKPDMTAREYMQPVDARTVQQLGHLEDMLRGKVAMPADAAARLGMVTIQ